MLRHRARSVSQLTQNRGVASTTSSGTLISRLSARTLPRNTEQKSPTPAELDEPRSSATSFISRQSARQRDSAAKKWFTDVRKLDINQVDDVKPPPDKKPKVHVPKKRQLRPKTDLNVLFSPSALSSATSLRLQNKKELGGDYTGYLPDGCTDPYRLPIDYARLVLGRNKNIPLPAQTGALSVIKEAIHGRSTKQGKYNLALMHHPALTWLTDRVV